MNDFQKWDYFVIHINFEENKNEVKKTLKRLVKDLGLYENRFKKFHKL